MTSPRCYLNGADPSPGTLPRCYLNGADPCRTIVLDSLLTADTSYDFFYQHVAAPAGRRLQGGMASSWGNLLRFQGIDLEGGRYKACFCDHEVAGLCKNLADFNIEVGSVHVSGVSCLLDDPKYTRGTCITQPYGGLRCHDEAPL